MQVKVYFNLHQRLFSVMHKNRVIGHAENLELKNCRFVVSQAGRQRVLREGRKNVHAYVIGDVECKNRTECLDNYVPVRYNPYRTSTFVMPSGEPVHGASSVVLKINGNQPLVMVPK